MPQSAGGGTGERWREDKLGKRGLAESGKNVACCNPARGSRLCSVSTLYAPGKQVHAPGFGLPHQRLPALPTPDGPWPPAGGGARGRRRTGSLLPPGNSDLGG